MIGLLIISSALGSVGLASAAAAWQAEGSIPPFHHAFPVHDLSLAKNFYGNVLGLTEGRSSARWQDYSLAGHQIVCHLVNSDYSCPDFYNPVDGDEVPVPHFGLAMTVDNFHAFASRLRDHGVKFIIEPHLRFHGQPGEQWTMFFKGKRCSFAQNSHPCANTYDGEPPLTAQMAFSLCPHIARLTLADWLTVIKADPSGNNLEFKAMTKPNNLFVKYNVVETDEGAKPEL